MFAGFPARKLGVSKRCRLTLRWPIAPSLYESKCGGEGGSCGVSDNEYSCTHHVTWSPNKLWRSTSILNLCLQIFFKESIASSNFNPNHTNRRSNYSWRCFQGQVSHKEIRWCCLHWSLVSEIHLADSLLIAANWRTGSHLADTKRTNVYSCLVNVN